MWRLPGDIKAGLRLPLLLLTPLALLRQAPSASGSASAPPARAGPARAPPARAEPALPAESCSQYPARAPLFRARLARAPPESCPQCSLLARTSFIVFKYNSLSNRSSSFRSMRLYLSKVLFLCGGGSASSSCVSPEGFSVIVLHWGRVLLATARLPQRICDAVVFSGVVR